MRILIIEDEVKIAEGLSTILESDGYQTAVAERNDGTISVTSERGSCPLCRLYNTVKEKGPPKQSLNRFY